MIDEAYEKSVLEWRARDDAYLRRENSWLALAGLFRLKPGRNTVGSDPSSDVLLPARAPASLGFFDFDGGTVRLHVADGLGVAVNDRIVREAALSTSKDPSPSFITLDDLRMVVHRHAGGYAIRLWDNRRDERGNPPVREWFPIDKKYRFEAGYELLDEPVKTMLPNIFGETEEWLLTGRLSLPWEGRTYTLDVSGGKDGAQFVQFKDLTSASETYPPGRYLYTGPVDGDRAVVDFNYAYNPPCVFTPYATCAFAPKQNHLPIRLEAGERYSAH